MASVEGAIRPILAQARSAGQLSLAILGGLPVRIRKGNHTFDELRQWKSALYGHRIPSGTVEVSIDKRTNQLLVGVATNAAYASWNDMIADERIPATAIRVERMSVPMPDLGIQDSVRPTAAGMQVIRYGLGGGGTNSVCTLGPNVTLPYALDPNQLYFITASHCTNSMWAADTNTNTWYQSLITGHQDIATGEELDPQPVTNGGSPHPSGWPTLSCPSGYVCRWSDAVLVRYSNSSWGTRGRLAVANSVLYPTVATVQSFKQMGWPRCFYNCPGGPVYKTGRTTGTTQSNGNSVDVDYYPDSAAYQGQGVTIRSNWVMVSQTKIYSMIADGGDSGSPVWMYDSLTDLSNPWLIGVYHAGNCAGCAGNRYVSSTSNVANDLAGGYWNMSWY
jgi:hypothetical protein